MSKSEETEPLWRSLYTVSAYKKLLELPPLKAAAGLLEELSAEAPRPQALLDRYTALFSGLYESGSPSLGRYLKEHILYDETPFSAAEAEGRADPELSAAAKNDLETLGRLSLLSSAAVKERMAGVLPSGWAEAAARLPEWKTEASPDYRAAAAFYRNSGSGIFARWRAFFWDGRRAVPVAHPDRVDPTELIGFETQREQVAENTRALIAGRRVNNVLLYGEAGTGKSATVKSLLNVPGFEELRIIEVDKDRMDTMAELIRLVGGRRQKFILFLDDLTFEDGDRAFSALKTILEGGLEVRPANVAIYATSNRRHLVRELFSERKEDEIDPGESIQDKTALSERFGIRIPYLALNQADYLTLVEALAERADLPLNGEALRAGAIQWERQHAGRTPRVARQFIDYLRSRAPEPEK